jgi:hypothetical protein
VRAAKPAISFAFLWLIGTGETCAVACLEDFVSEVLVLIDPAKRNVPNGADCGPAPMTNRNCDRAAHRRRTTFSLAVICAALIAAPAAFGQPRQPDPDMGARLVEARCTACHGAAGTQNAVARCVAAHGEDYLDPFLKRHHAPDAEARADIIAYLTCPPGAPPSEGTGRCVYFVNTFSLQYQILVKRADLHALFPRLRAQEILAQAPFSGPFPNPCAASSSRTTSASGVWTNTA